MASVSTCRLGVLPWMAILMTRTTLFEQLINIARFIVKERKTGRPKATWRRTIAEEVKKHGTTWKEMKKAASNRMRWKKVVSALSSTLSEED